MPSFLLSLFVIIAKPCGSNNRETNQSKSWVIRWKKRNRPHCTLASTGSNTVGHAGAPPLISLCRITHDTLHLVINRAHINSKTAVISAIDFCPLSCCKVCIFQVINHSSSTTVIPDFFFSYKHNL